MGVSELVDSINLATSRSSELNDEDRVKLLSACEKLQSSLEGPRDKLMKMIFCSLQPEALSLAVDMEIFDSSSLVCGWKRNSSRRSCFAKRCQSVAYCTTQNEVVAALLTYFAQKGYQSPNDAYDGPFQFARQTDLRCFDWMATQPRIQHAFNTVMTIPRTTGRAAWYEYFPVAEKLKVETPSDRLIVDIGGGIGHDSVRFKEVHPKLQGKLIIEDIPVVVSSVAQGSLPDGIEAQSYDFFKPQPICNAKAYFLADVLHDWPDTQASVILEQFKDAIGKESVLLINENLMQEENASFESAYTD